MIIVKFLSHLIQRTMSGWLLSSFYLTWCKGLMSGWLLSSFYLTWYKGLMSGWLLSSFYLTWYKGLWVDDYCQVFISPDTKDYEWMIIVKFLSHPIQRTMSGWLLSSFYLTWYKGLWVDDYCQVFISPDTKDYEWMIIVKFLSHLIQRTMSGWLLSSFYLTWYKGLWVDDYCQVFISPDTEDYEWMIIVKFLSHLIHRTNEWMIIVKFLSHLIQRGSGWLLSSFYLTWYKGLWVDDYCQVFISPDTKDYEDLSSVCILCGGGHYHSFISFLMKELGQMETNFVGMFHWWTLFELAYQKSKLTTIAWHNLTLDPLKECIKRFSLKLQTYLNANCTWRINI